MKLNKQKLVLIMAERCLNISELAQDAELNASALSALINKKDRKATLKTIGTLAKALEVPVQDLIEE